MKKIWCWEFKQSARDVREKFAHRNLFDNANFSFFLTSPCRCPTNNGSKSPVYRAFFPSKRFPLNSLLIFGCVLIFSLQILQTPLKEADPEISSILAHEVQRQKESIVLIASEVYITL